jgi:DNA/RNA-binding domain of Phe-tRNA-synthetase-like protein
MKQIELQIAPDLKARAGLVLGVVRAEPVTITRHDNGLWDEIEALVRQLRERNFGSAAERPEIGATRRAYRALGDDPTHYRPANEALLRRVLGGKTLPHINTAVDANTFLSLESGWPLGCYDVAAIEGPIGARQGSAGETYAPIGKPAVDAQNRLVLVDDQGIFGSPTADSQRTLVTTETTDLLFVIFAFETGQQRVDQIVERAAALLKRYCGGTLREQQVL